MRSGMRTRNPIGSQLTERGHLSFIARRAARNNSSVIMFVDSHCHLDFPELASNLPNILEDMSDNQVGHALVVAVSKPEWARIREMVAAHPQLFASVGVHPDYKDTEEPTVEELVELANEPKTIAIGETGLDYYRGTEPFDWQRERFRVH